MTLVEEPERPGVFTVTWSIDNFSWCKNKEKDPLYSPYFFVGGIKWYLSLYPKENESRGFASFYLSPANYEKWPESNTFMYVLSIRKCNGLFKNSSELSIAIENHKPDACEKFISLYDLNEPHVYLESDTLTLRCQIWKKDDNLSESRYVFARTKINIFKLDYEWILDDFIDSDGKPKYKFQRSAEISLFSEIPKINVHISTGEILEDAVYFVIDRPYDSNTSYTNNCSVFVGYNVHLLDCNGSIAQSVRGEYYFENSKDICKFPFLSKCKLLSNKELYLPDRKLTLKCELSFSGELIVEKIECGLTESLKLKPVEAITDLVSDGHTIWKENMRQFYSDGKYSDLIVRTPKREFKVHRAILCAQSEVFDAMLTHDMKENNTGVFEIKDFEDETVSKMLMFLYTNTLGDIDYSLAKDLYMVADKYRITPLAKICSNHMKDNMDILNVCDILLLADKLRNQELKACARDFIVFRAFEIMSSDGWKQLMATDSQLTSETMQWMIFNNFLDHKK